MGCTSEVLPLEPGVLAAVVGIEGSGGELVTVVTQHRAMDDCDVR